MTLSIIYNFPMIRVAINGFGRIGRTTFRVLAGRHDVQCVAMNDLAEPKTLAHLLKYDSVFRRFAEEVKADAKHLIIGGKKIPVFAEKDPAMLPWKELNVDVVIESTGLFTKQEDAARHLDAGAKRVIISSPSEDAPTFLMGVNHKTYKKNQSVINNASCTTNSVAPVAQIMDEVFGVKKAMLTTMHSVTAEQNLVDGLPPRLHPDLRRARSGLINMIPTSTGAAKAATKVIPSLKGKFDGIAVRVPSLDVSLTDFTFVTKKNVTVEEITKAFRVAAKTPRWKQVLGVTDEPLVSSDFIGTPYACVVDLEMIRVVDGDLVKVLAWYDNEWGYSTMLVEMAAFVGKA